MGRAAAGVPGRSAFARSLATQVWGVSMAQVCSRSAGGVTPLGRALLPKVSCPDGSQIMELHLVHSFSCGNDLWVHFCLLECLVCHEYVLVKLHKELNELSVYALQSGWSGTGRPGD